MKEIFQQLLSKLAVYFLFALVILLIFVCLMTGEFPPKIQSVKDQYQSFIDLKKNYTLVMKNASERLKNADPEKGFEQQNTQNSIAINQLQKMTEVDHDLIQNVKEIRIDQARLQTQLDLIIQQNREILLRLNGLHPIQK